jgi:1-acyl-sn-glycerol-3-phosphate acyltransferase
VLGRLVLPAAFRLHITGRENFPRKGPLIVVGNHVAAMEAPLMVVYAPWQVELVGAADIPHEKITEFVMWYFGFIPVRRGHVDRSAMDKALGVLHQGGVIGIFPEGGVWSAGKMRPQTGVAWLSYRGRAPVLPMGFGGTLGALGAALRLQRPHLQMNVGRPLPAASPPPGRPRKQYLEEYSLQVMEAVRDLIPAEEREHESVVDERFELEVAVKDGDGEWIDPPEDVQIRQDVALARLLHNPVSLKVFQENLRLNVESLQNIAAVDDGRVIADAVKRVLNYLQEDNPYFLAYRFGPQEAERMQMGLEELLRLGEWAARMQRPLKVVPVRRYFSPAEGREIVQRQQGGFKGWM